LLRCWLLPAPKAGGMRRSAALSRKPIAEHADP
jgi:hypothetical protein